MQDGDTGLLWGTPWRAVERVAVTSDSETVLAEHTVSGERAHVKVVPLDLVEDRETVEARQALGERVRLEADALRALRCERVPELRDAGLTPDGRPYFAMAIMEDAEPLAALLAARGALPVGETCVILRDVLAALEAAHALGLVHRDVKPSNILVSHGRAWLTDFGIAKVVGGQSLRGLEQATTAGRKLGSPRFLSPEQALGKPVDARTDLYQVGLVAFQCLAGEGPHDRDARGPSGWANTHAFNTAPRVRERAGQEIPEALDEWVATALQKLPNKRFASATAMATALDACLPAEVDPLKTVEQRPIDRELLVEKTAPRADPPTEPMSPVDLAKLTRDLAKTGAEPPSARAEKVATTEPARTEEKATQSTSEPQRLRPWVLVLAGALLGAALLWAVQRGLAP